MSKSVQLSLASFVALCCPACILVVHDGELEWGGGYHHSVEHRGSGVRAREVRECAEFTRIEPCGGTFDLHVRIGGPQEVAVVADDNLLQYVETEVKDGALRIGLRSGSYEFRADARIEIVVARLEKLVLHGAGDADLEGFDGGDLRLEITGAGDVSASGRVDRLEARVHGAGDLELFGLSARVVKLELAGAGDVELTATEELEIVASGAGDIDYRGNPAKVRTHASGAGDISPR